MPTWLTPEWWQLVWVPALGIGLTWLASTLKTKNEARSAADTRIDARIEKWTHVLEGDRDELRIALEISEAEALKWETIARWWWRRCHELSHTLQNVKFATMNVMRRNGEPIPPKWEVTEELPPLESPWPNKVP